MSCHDDSSSNGNNVDDNNNNNVIYKRLQRLRTQIMNYLRFNQMYSLRWLKVLAAAPEPPPSPQITRKQQCYSSKWFHCFSSSMIVCAPTPIDRPTDRPNNINQNHSNNKLIGFLCLPTKPIRCNDMTGLMRHALVVVVVLLLPWKHFAPSPKSTNLLLILIRPTYFSVIFTTNFVLVWVCKCMCVATSPKLVYTLYMTAEFFELFQTFYIFPFIRSSSSSSSTKNENLSSWRS